MENTTTLLPLVRRHWRLLAASAVTAAAIAYALTTLASPTYQSRLQLLVGPLNTDLRTLQASGELSRTYAELATSRPILEEAIRAAGATTTADELKDAERVTATSNQVTRVVDILVEDTSPREAARLANALGERIKTVTTDAPSQNEEVIDSFMRQDEVRELPEAAQREIESAARTSLGQSLAGTVRIIDPATPPTQPAAPASKLITVLAALAGLLIAGVLVLVRASSGERIEDEQDLAGLANVTPLGSIDAVRSRDPVRALIVESRPDSPAAERYRLLAAKAGFLQRDRPVRSILALGAGDGATAAVVAANLAMVLAEAGRRVLLIDTGGAAGPSRLFGLEGQPGYGDLLTALREAAVNGRLDELAVQRADDLEVLPRGAPAPPGLLDGETAEIILERALGRVDLVLIAAPPIDQSPAALVWGRLAEATILVADEGRTDRQSVSDVVSSLDMVGARLLGTVLGRPARAGLLPASRSPGATRG